MIHQTIHQKKITFNSDYAKSLAVGEHTLKVAVADGEVSTTFTIENSSEKVSTTTTNPATGDNIIIYITLFVISLLGIIAISIKSKKC